MDSEFYIKDESQIGNIVEFQKLIRRYSWAETYQPSPEVAPWHWIMVIKHASGGCDEIHIYPHKAKAYLSGDKRSVSGWDNVRNIISTSIELDGGDREGVIE